MSIQHSDPYRTLAYDPMHNDGHGISGIHLLTCVLTCLKAKGRDALAELDERCITAFLTSEMIQLFI